MRKLFSKGEFIWIMIMLLMCAMFVLSSCTENTRVKAFGGKMIIELPENTKLVNATWKENELWILTKDMKSLDVAETYKFSERSNFGLLEGEITFKEVKK